MCRSLNLIPNLKLSLKRLCSPNPQLSLKSQVLLPPVQLLLYPRTLRPPSLPAPLSPNPIHKFLISLLRHPFAHARKRLDEWTEMVESR